MEKLLSIIIPTYNMEKYLNKCLDSLLIKTGLEYLEVIVVNDGSSDSSLSIAQAYQQKYPDVFVIIDKTNGNYGSCINAGLPVAKGKYIKILDADDSFSTPILEELIKNINGIDVDLLLTDYVTIDEGGQTLSQYSYQYPELQIFDFPRFFTDRKASVPYIHMHNVAYKRENIIHIKYKQTEGISYTDVEWTFIPMTTVKTAYYLKKPLYKYLLGRAGQTVNPKTLMKNMYSMEKLSFSLIDKYNTCHAHLTPLYQEYLFYRAVVEVSRIYRLYLAYKNTDTQALIKFDAQIKQLNQDIYKHTEGLTINRYLKYIKVWRDNKNRKCIYPFLRYNLKLNNCMRAFFSSQNK